MQTFISVPYRLECGVSRKSEPCRSMLTTVEEFADTCMATIDSFMGMWSVDAAMDKTNEMCYLLTLGEMMECGLPATNQGSADGDHCSHACCRCQVQRHQNSQSDW